MSLLVNRGYYTVSKRYGFYPRVAKISRELSAAKRVRCLATRRKIHIFWKPCNVLFIIWVPNKLLRFFKIFGKSSEIFGKLRKRFKSNFQMFLWFYEKFRKIFGNLRKFSENFGNGSKVIFRCFYDFLIFSENLQKCSEIFGDIFISEDMENILR